MNVIIANKNKVLLQNLGIDVIKEMTGEFSVDEIISSFQNFFYQKMIIDITAIKDYTDIKNLQKLSISLNMDKTILLLDGTESTSNPKFLSNLVSMGIYNFTKTLDGIQYLYNTPNSYRDVAQFHDLSNNIVESQPKVITKTVVVPAKQEEVIIQKSNEPIIIGIKNVTKQAGATTLAYLMKKHLSGNYNVVAIEVDKSDFVYFKDKDLISTITSEVGIVLKKYNDKDVIIVDLNNSLVAEGFCGEVIYLIEPSIIKLQKLIALNAIALQNLRGKKVILNKCLLDINDIANFEYESRLKVFSKLIPVNDRAKKIPEINELLVKLGFNKQN